MEFSFWWACVFMGMYSVFYCLVFHFIEVRFIVLGNNAFYIFGAVIANFDIISVENTVKFMIFWEVVI